MSQAAPNLLAPAPRGNESFLALALRRFRRHKLAQAGLMVLILLTLAAIFAPPLSPYTFDGQDPALLGQPTAPSLKHPMGTDQLGRDNATRILYGARVSLLVGLSSALVATLLGTLIGALAGFYGGWTDTVLMRFTDMVLSIPVLPLVIALSGFLRPNLGLLVLIIGGLGWMSTARLVRSQFLSLRTREYVEASRALGSSNARIMFRHILPNALGPIVVSATLAVGGPSCSSRPFPSSGLAFNRPPLPGATCSTERATGSRPRLG